MFKLTAAKALSGYRLWLRYQDGTEGEVDVSDLAGRGVFEAWKERSFFDNLHIDASGALAWENNLDLCPDALYPRLTGKSPEDVFPNLKASGMQSLR